MKSIIFLFIGALTLSTSLASAAPVPVHTGNVATVNSVHLQPDPAKNGSHIIATVQYNALCGHPDSFVVVWLHDQDYEVFESRVRVPGTANCGAIAYTIQDIEVGLVAGPSSGVVVNGVTAQP